MFLTSLGISIGIFANPFYSFPIRLLENPTALHVKNLHKKAETRKVLFEGIIIIKDTWAEIWGDGEGQMPKT